MGRDPVSLHVSGLPLAAAVERQERVEGLEFAFCDSGHYMTLSRGCLEAVVVHTVTTTCALHTRKNQARQILRGGGDYLFIVKGNQRPLYDDISAAFTVLPPHGSCEQAYWQYEVVTVHYYTYGRTELITLESTTALSHYLPFPGVAQVVRRTPCATKHSSGKTTVSTGIITSLCRDRVTLHQIEAFRCGHGTIENVTHYPCDESFGEDRSHVRAGQCATSLSCTAQRGCCTAPHRRRATTLPAGFCYCRKSPQRSLQLLGISGLSLP